MFFDLLFENEELRREKTKLIEENCELRERIDRLNFTITMLEKHEKKHEKKISSLNFKLVLCVYISMAIILLLFFGGKVK